MNILNQLPCPVLITSRSGIIKAANNALLTVLGKTKADLLTKNMDELMPLASRIFMQTHIFPMLLQDEKIQEIYLKINGKDNEQIPILTNCSSGIFEGSDCYFWILFVTHERSKFEKELLIAQKRTETVNIELTKSENFIKTVSNAVPALVAYWDKDLRRRFANKAYREWFGINTESTLGIEPTTPHEAQLFSTNQIHIHKILTGEPQEFECALSKTDGSTRDTLARYIPDKNTHDQVIGFYVLISDVTSIKSAQTEIKLAASVFHHTLEGIMVTDTNGTIISVNPAFTQITGYDAEDAIGKTPRILKSNHHKLDFYEALWQQITTSGHWQGEIWNRRKNGEAFLEWQTITTIRGDNDEPLRYVSVFNDITERWQKDERIRFLAFHDALTEIPNRLLLIERLNQLIAAAARQPNKSALLYLDLDGFKQINDNLGHDAGDEVLKIVAQKLQAEIRTSDTVARLGGDEFVVLLTHPIDLAGASRIADRIIDIINEPIKVHELVVDVGVSLGIAIYPDDGQAAEQLMKHADEAMYQAKLAGKNQYRIFKDQR